MGTVGAMAALAPLAEAQQGLFTTRQAQRRGVHRRDLSRLAHNGALECVAYGVYRVAGSPRPEQEELRAAWLQLAPDREIDRRGVDHGVISHSSATLVYEVGLLDPLRMEFIIPLPRRVRSRRSDVLIHRATIADHEVEWVNELPVTGPQRTVSDLAAVRLDGNHLALVVDDLLRRGPTGRDQLAEALASHAAAYGFAEGDGQEFLRHLTDQ